jgi:hypothetical protein
MTGGTDKETIDKLLDEHIDRFEQVMTDKLKKPEAES